ncbi:MBOAT family protein [Campylobacter sp. MIT 12-8780]|uniref:MBOAT family O-acyltransferase n=1 Tax=unclassified Campylobacter TaxID=2593542 RepID=UPI0010F59E8F|nr:MULTISPECIES: MBOAT family O-acyltransferase [unclassified Campylobacter]NDJ26887.1 MBOAT family protein [Campylobacter sp. MIT 19-121]TKX28631.1 MBOAT family protein [Campylobacter sp. MIT 12-5580]TQR41969.1 MBOAT family protein [Campylobacter sp. MIT 12-8780]
MTYFSLEFALMFCAFFVLYWCFKESFRAQNIFILAFSYIVYILMNPYFALVLFVYTFFIHYFALLIFVRQKRYIFAACISFAVLNLCFFKYFTSIKDSFDQFLAFFGFEYLNSDLIFPVGISFYTFASITYLVSVYKEHKIETFLNLATYLSFFPTLLAGPIMRSEFFFKQIHQRREFSNGDLIIFLLVLGIIKKVLIANYLGIYSKEILANPSTHNFLELLCAIYAFSVQIYCDFSGYVNLVTAFALMLGFNLPKNFDMPYLSKNLKEFWSRWHISLSTFIRDYIYIPLGGSKKGRMRTYVNLLIAFALSGIWHNNTINFLFWGLLHGLGVVFLHLPFIQKINLQKIPYLGSFLTFHFVAFAWIFFYYPSFDKAFEYLKACVDNFFFELEYKDIYIFASFVALFIIYPLFVNFQKHCVRILHITPLFLKPILLALILLVVFAFMPSGIPQFIYESF